MKRNDGILVSVTGWDPQVWVDQFRRLTDRPVTTEAAGTADPSIRFAVVWKQRPGVLESLPNLKAIFSIGAGVDHLFRDSAPPDLPIVRVVAEDLTMRMSEFVVWQVLDHFRQGRIYRENQQNKIWREPFQPAACDLTVGVMGLGVLGADAAYKLKGLGFNVAGWSRRPKEINGIVAYHGTAQLPEFIGQSDIIVVLLPLTADTKGILNASLFQHLKQKTPIGGPVLINAGRGLLQIEKDILEALDSRRLMAASLDVFETEPLPNESALWSHPRVFVTPHAAATSDPARLAPIMVRQMDGYDAGLPLTNLVDRKAGY